MTLTSKDANPWKRRIFLALITLAIGLLGWLLLFPAQSGLHSDTRVTSSDEDTLSCDSVLFVGPSSSEVRGAWDGDRVIGAEIERKQLAHAACNAFRTQRVGLSVLVAVPLVYLLLRLPPGPPSRTDWGEGVPLAGPSVLPTGPHVWPN